MIIFNSLCLAQIGVDFKGLDFGCIGFSLFGGNFCLVSIMNRSSKALGRYPLSPRIFFYLRFRPESYNSHNSSSQRSTSSTSTIHILGVCTSLTVYKNFNADVD